MRCFLLSGIALVSCAGALFAQAAAPAVQPGALLAQAAAPAVQPGALLAQAAAPAVQPGALLAQAAAPAVQSAVPAAAQPAAQPASQPAASQPAAQPAAVQPVPDGFRAIRLGMSLDDAKVALAKDSYFDYHGDPDVSMLQKPDDNLIECAGFSYIKRAYFEFHAKRLYTIILVLNPDEIGYYSMYTHLVARYGEPASLSPQSVVWESDRYRLSLEHPLSVKYIDRRVFDQLLAAGTMQQSQRAVSREDFVNQF